MPACAPGEGLAAVFEWVLSPSPYFVSGGELGATYFDFPLTTCQFCTLSCMCNNDGFKMFGFHLNQLFRICTVIF